MAASVEHSFLSETALNIMEESAKSQLFSCKEAGRKRFDFACDLTRDWTRVVSGQTLWKHDRDGVDKDIRTLLADEDAAAVVYVARDSVSVRGRVEEVIRDYRNTPLRDSLSKLRIFWVPSDFDADDENARLIVREGLRRDISRDLLLRVALGDLTADQVRGFTSSGRMGFPLWLLAGIAKVGYVENFTNASKRWRIGVPIIKEELLRLTMTGLVSRDEPGPYRGLIQVSDKGRAMLDICAHLHGFLSGASAENPELLYICKLLGVDFSSISPEGGKVDFDFFESNKDLFLPLSGASNTVLLLTCLYYSAQWRDGEWSSFALARI
ncbi:hypothetical protein [Streptomyces uncialis]|uniref:hypothetical protein n=1 Tax=Streptomyces uncialis TaxID=1048205 RepID=UPI003409F035